jgi:hypothetical protein
MPAEIWVSFREVCKLRRVEEDPRINVQRIAAAEVSMFRLSGEFPMNNHFTNTTTSEYKPSLILIITQGWCFANGFSQNAL